MFSTCIRCRNDLGRNRLLSHLPVGQRIAYELTHGRLWVVCARCGAWNLTPIEDRWEALEECERLFTSASVRASDATIGLAQIGQNTELVRIGASATRSDIANWRYGIRLRRRRGWFLYGAAILAGLSIALIPKVHFTIEFPLVAAWVLAIVAVWVVTIRNFLSEKLLKLQLSNARLRDHVSLGDLPQVRLRRSGDRGHIGVILPSRASAPMLFGAPATAYLSKILPLLNWMGGSPNEIEAAIALVEKAEGPALRDEAQLAPWERLLRGKKRVTLIDLPMPQRLALEMAVEEARELKALEGRAIRLQPAWEEAEEIAAIADDLLVPPTIHTWLARLKLLKGKPPNSAA